MNGTPTEKEVEALAWVLRSRHGDMRVTMDAPTAARHVLRSDWLAERDKRMRREGAADAWDEGWAARNAASLRERTHALVSNPYRAAAEPGQAATP